MFQNPVDKIGPLFRERLIRTKVKDVCPKLERVVIARSNETIAEVFKKLIDNRITSVPLLDVTASKYVAFLDMFDILAYVIVVLNLQLQTDEWPESSQFKNTNCLALVGRSPRSDWKLISSEAPLQGAINEMQSAHRMAVIDEQGNLFSILTQYRLARWLSARSDMSLGDISSMAVEDFGLGMKGYVATVSSATRAVDAFVQMYMENLSGLAVLDSNGAVIGNMSVSDLKEIDYSAQMFRGLYITVGDFLIHKRLPYTRSSLVWVDKYDTIKTVLDNYRKHKIHRIYILEPGSKVPIGVITLTDIMRLFSNFPRNA